VLIGQPGFPRRDPDFLALLVGNHILGGGGFTSRLTEEVREKRGLSYSVYSYFAGGLHAGAFTIGLQTRPDQAAQAVKVSRDVLQRFVRRRPHRGRAACRQRQPDRRLCPAHRQQPEAAGQRGQHRLERPAARLPGPLDQKVEALTVADVRAAMARKLQPERMVTVVVGGKP
jgi:zinc protease